MNRLTGQYYIFGLVLLCDGGDVLVQVGPRGFAVLDGQDPVLGQGEVVGLGGGRQHGDQALRVVAPARVLLFREELPESGDAVVSGETERVSVLCCFLVNLGNLLTLFAAPVGCLLG
mgnify:CR=1 FL=1